MPSPYPIPPAAVTLEYSQLRVKSYAPAIVSGISSIGMGLAGTTVSFYLASTLNSVPPGASIRPMALAAVIMLSIGGTFLLGSVLGVACIIMGLRRWRLWLLALFGIGLSCFAPWIVSQAEMDQVVAKNHLNMES